MDGERTHIDLSRLGYDTVQSTYKELHALLDSLSDEDDERQERLAHYLLETRHRLVRLLVAVRWFMSYSAFHNSATITKRISSNKSELLNVGADTLFEVSMTSRGAALNPHSVQEAAEVLGAASLFTRLPRVIESAIGLDFRSDQQRAQEYAVSQDKPPVNVQANYIPKKPLKPANAKAQVEPNPVNCDNSYGKAQDRAQSASVAGDESDDDDVTPEAVERLRLLTTEVVRGALPNGVRVISSNVGPRGAAIRVGVPNAWSADLILDQLKVEDALIILLSFEIMVDGHPDAPSKLRHVSHSVERSVPIRNQDRLPLRRMLEDRIRWATTDARIAGHDNPLRFALQSLSRVMNFECCGKLAMSHVQSQAQALADQEVWKIAHLAITRLERANVQVPAVKIQYWKKSHMAASLRISLSGEEQTVSSAEDILIVNHESDLPSHERPLKVLTSCIHVEELLLNACRARASCELNRLKSLCDAKLGTNSKLLVERSMQSSVSLGLYVDGRHSGLTIGISLCTGGLFVRSRGMLSLALARSDSRAAELQAQLWTGERFFRRDTLEIQTIFVDLIAQAVDLMRSTVTLRNMDAIGNGAMMSWPPGVASVQKLRKSMGSSKPLPPPFTPIDRKRPRRFLTLESTVGIADEPFRFPGVSSAKRARCLPLHYSTSSDGCAYVEGRRPNIAKPPGLRDMFASSAYKMAEWSEIRHTVDLRLRRDHLLRELEGMRLASPSDGDYMLQSPHRTELVVKTSPMEIEKALLLLKGDESWEVELTVSKAIFDDHNYAGLVVSFAAKPKILRFSYHSLSSFALKAFSRDFVRARTAAALAVGLDLSSRYYSVRRRLPTHVEVEAYGMRFVAGLGKHAVQLDAFPKTGILQSQLVPMMEELLNESGKEMGYRLHDLIEMSVPIGLGVQAAVAGESAVCRVRFFTALRVRFLIGIKAKRETFAIDIDGRMGKMRAIVLDAGRVHVAKKDEKGKDVGGIRFKAVPGWEGIVNKLVSENVGNSIHDGRGVLIPTKILGNVLTMIKRSLG